MWVAIKNIPLSYFFEGFFFTFSRYLFQAMGAFTGRGAAGEFAKSLSKWQLAWILLKAHLSALLGIPKMIAKRRKIQSTRKVTPAQIRELFNRFGISAKDIAYKC